MISVSLAMRVAAMILKASKPEFSTSRYHLANRVFAKDLLGVFA